MPRPVPPGSRRHRQPTPGWAPPWNRARLLRFVGEVEAVLDARFGPAVVDIGRGVATFATPAGETQLWLHRLADRCAPLPVGQWRLAIYDHIATLDDVARVYDDLIAGRLGPIRPRLGVRLHRADVAVASAVDAVTGPAFGELVAMLVVDLGGSAAWVPREVTNTWPVTADGLFDEAIDRTVAKLRVEVEVVGRDGLEVLAASGASFLTATLALRPDQLGVVEPELGAVVAAPSSHRVLVHRLGRASRPALQLMAALTGPDAVPQGSEVLSPSLYWWRPARGYRELARAGPGAVAIPRELELLLEHGDGAV